MAAEKFPFLRQATQLYHADPQPLDILEQLESLSDKAGEDTPEARMIGGFISSIKADQDD
ncbi:Terminase small subunit [Erwinia rhapontici]|uniref:hypothetical protein n=1 Tax=Erwinia rhapontici TaxID=55212 RepID=UPI003D367E14